MAHEGATPAHSGSALDRAVNTCHTPSRFFCQAFAYLLLEYARSHFDKHRLDLAFSLTKCRTTHIGSKERTEV